MSLKDGGLRRILLRVPRAVSDCIGLIVLIIAAARSGKQSSGGPYLHVARALGLDRYGFVESRASGGRLRNTGLRLVALWPGSTRPGWSYRRGRRVSCSA